MEVASSEEKLTLGIVKSMDGPISRSKFTTHRVIIHLDNLPKFCVTAKESWCNIIDDNFSFKAVVGIDVEYEELLFDSMPAN